MSEELKCLIVTDYQAGASLRSICKKWHIPPNTIRILLKKKGVYEARSFKGASFRVSQIIDEAAAKRLTSGSFSYKEIARELKVSPQIIKKRLIELGFVRKESIKISPKRILSQDFRLRYTPENIL
jgi:uncharacterized protein YjcR